MSSHGALLHLIVHVHCTMNKLQKLNRFMWYICHLLQMKTLDLLLKIRMVMLHEQLKLIGICFFPCSMFLIISIMHFSPFLYLDSTCFVGWIHWGPQGWDYCAIAPLSLKFHFSSLWAWPLCRCPLCWLTTPKLFLQTWKVYHSIIAIILKG